MVRWRAGFASFKLNPPWNTYLGTKENGGQLCEPGRHLLSSGVVTQYACGQSLDLRKVPWTKRQAILLTAQD
jgi:hypothetical protein